MASGGSAVDETPAWRELRVLEAHRQVDLDKAQMLREKLTELYRNAHKLAVSEHALTSKAESLGRQLVYEKARVDSISGRSAEEVTAVQLLREDAEQAEAEAAVCKERETILQAEMAELQRVRNNLKLRVQKAEDEQDALVAPQIEKLRAERDALLAERDAEVDKRDAAASEVAESRARLAAAHAEVLEQEKLREEERRNVSKSRVGPEKLKRVVASALEALGGLRAQEAKQDRLIADAEAKEAERTALGKKLTDDHSRTSVALDRARLAMETKERNCEEYEKDLELARVENEQIRADRLMIHMREKQMLSSRRVEADHMTRAQKDKEKAGRALRKADLALNQAKEMILPLEGQLDATQRERASCDAAVKEREAAVNGLKGEINVAMNAYIREESIGKDKAALFQASYADVAGLENEVAAHKKDEQVRAKSIVELSAQRERISRQAAMKQRKCKETAELVNIKDLTITDLKKRRKEMQHRLKDFTQLYDLVKSQRNKFTNLIISSGQSIAEMKEKLRILGNEVDILREEVVSKDKVLSKAHTGLQTSIHDREALRMDLNRALATFRERQDNVDQQISEIDRLNALISSYEKEMLRLKKQYETQIERRNVTGIMLVDRNDELCILYEKSNVQEEVMRQGEMVLGRQDAELRMLKLEIKEVERSKFATLKMVPLVPELDKNIAYLQQQLHSERKEAESLSQALESPTNKMRWRRLEGKIPDKEELAAKINHLEGRLSDKREQLLEKELILEEVTTLSDRLRQQAADGREETLDLARKVNDYQSRIRATTRKIMATVSELSMNQASALKLQADKASLEELRDDAVARFESGDAPTEDAAREWNRMERERGHVAAMQAAAAERSVAGGPDGEGSITRTTAEPRPNAYIPDELGIPKPYGRYAPFKPQDESAMMRHIRKPEPREIVI